MTSLLIFLLAIPLSVEMSGRLLGLRDIWLIRGERPAALQRLIAPTIVLGLMISWASPDHIRPFLTGLLLAPAWQLVNTYTMRFATRFTRFQPRSVSTRDRTE